MRACVRVRARVPERALDHVCVRAVGVSMRGTFDGNGSALGSGVAVGVRGGVGWVGLGGMGLVGWERWERLG
jgi:hypothetical protein